MNRIVNNPDFVVEDMLKGFVKTHKDIVSTTEDARVLKYKNAPVEGKVGIVTGGGSGHKPAFIGYIGENLCDAVAVGESILRCNQRSRLWKRCCMSLWKLCWRQYECKDGNA